MAARQDCVILRGVISGDVLAADLEGLPHWVRNALHQSFRATQVYELALLTERELLGAKGIGRTALVEIQRFLEERGLTLATAERTVKASSWLETIVRRLENLERKTSLSQQSLQRPE